VITVSTALDIHNINTVTHHKKYVMVGMDVDDAFALATILLNMPVGNISEDWRQSVSMFAKELIDAGNRCRT
jgi:hypothetical protein